MRGTKANLNYRQGKSPNFQTKRPLCWSYLKVKQAVLGILIHWAQSSCENESTSGPVPWTEEQCGQRWRNTGVDNCQILYQRYGHESHLRKPEDRFFLRPNSKPINPDWESDKVMKIRVKYYTNHQSFGKSNREYRFEWLYHYFFKIGWNKKPTLIFMTPNLRDQARKKITNCICLEHTEDTIGGKMVSHIPYFRELNTTWIGLMQEPRETGSNPQNRR